METRGPIPESVNSCDQARSMAKPEGRGVDPESEWSASDDQRKESNLSRIIRE